MKKKIMVTVMSLILMATSAAPAFAESTGASVAQDQQIEAQQNDTALTEPEAKQEEPQAEEPAKTQQKNQEQPNEQNPVVQEESKTPSVVSYEATSPEFQKLHIEWALENADRVKVYVSPDRSMQGVSPSTYVKASSCDIKIPDKDKWKATYIRIVPYNKTEAGKLVEFGIDIFDDYKPASTKITGSTTFRSEDGVSLPAMTITDKKGDKIDTSYLKIASKSSNYPGKNTMTVKYTGIYSGLPDIDIKYTLLPAAPNNLSASWLEKDTIKFNVSLPKQYYSDGTKYCDSVIVECSKSSDYSNPKRLTITKDTKYEKKQFTGLTKNTKYYIRARSIKKTDNENLYSDWVSITAKTTGNAPSTSISNITTKKIIANMRGNSTFTITLPNLVSRSDTYDYIRSIRNCRPHLDKFDISYTSKKDDCSAISSVTFKYNSTKAKEANAVNKKVMKIVRGAKKKKGVRAKVKYVNKQLCKTCSYHWKAYKAHKKGNYPEKYKHCYDAYGCLVEHKAVCSGYSEAFAAIMTELNIPNTYAHSPNHRWNKVKIGKKWYHVDVTWNDCTHSNKYLLKKSHPKK